MQIILMMFVMLFLSSCKDISKEEKFLQREKIKESLLIRVKNYPALINIYKERLVKKDTPLLRMKLAKVNYLDGQYEEALFYMQPLVNKRLINKEGLILYLRSLLLVGKYFPIINHARNFGEKTQEAKILNIYAIAYLQNGNIKEGQKYLNRAKRKFIDEETFANNQAMIYMLKGNYKEAISILSRLYNRGSKNSKVIHNLVLALVKNKDYDKAFDLIESENLHEYPRILIHSLMQVNISGKL